MTEVIKVVDTSQGKKGHKEWLYAGAFILILLSMVTVFYWLNYPREIYTINNNRNENGLPCEPDRSHHESFYRGCGIQATASEEAISYVSDFCSNANGTGTVRILFINRHTNVEVSRIESPIAFKKGTCTDRLSLLPNPKLSSGHYYIRFLVDVKVNPIKTIHKETQTLSWVVE